MQLFRFTETHDIVNRLINVTYKCFFECNIRMFSDVSSNAINIIYQVSSVIYSKYKIIYIFVLVDS